MTIPSGAQLSEINKKSGITTAKRSGIVSASSALSATVVFTVLRRRVESLFLFCLETERRERPAAQAAQVSPVARCPLLLSGIIIDKSQVGDVESRPVCRSSPGRRRLSLGSLP